MRTALALAAVCALVLALALAAADRVRVAPRLYGFWGDAGSNLHRLAPGGPELLRFDTADPALAEPCRLSGFRRVVCGGGEAGRIGLDARRIFWDDGDVWLRQGL